MFKFKSKEDKPLSKRQLKRIKLINEVSLLITLNEWADVINKTITNVGEIAELSKQMKGATPEEIINAIVGKLDTKKDGE